MTPAAGTDGAESRVPPKRPPRRRRERHWPGWLIVLTTVAVMLALISVLLAVVRLPFFTISPGPSKQVEPLVEIENAKTYDSSGELLLTTVSVTPVNGWELIRSIFDPDDQLVSREAINQGHTDEEVNEINKDMMENSKLIAIDIALRQLGYDVELVGKGALVTDVLKDGPAAEVLRPGDVIVGVDDRPVTVASEVSDALTSKKAGDSVKLEIRRDGSTKTVQAQMVIDPENPQRAIIGVILTTEELRVQTPGSDIDIQIDAGDIGGPSAGLVYTLAIINDLTPEGITKGKLVAATGEINPDGTVGAIGGVAQKVRSVEAAGADIFLVPQANLEEAQTVDADVQVVGVATVQDALAALQSL